MKRNLFIGIILGPALVIPIIASSESQIITLLMWHIGLVIPIATFVRMKYVGSGYKDMLRSFIPIIGLRYIFKVFQKDKKRVDN